MIMKNTIVLFLALSLSVQKGVSQPAEPEDTIGRIQICLLIDLSGSMSGLLAQTQGQIWKMASFLSGYEKNGRPAIVEFAVLSYGNEAYPESGHIRIVSPFTSGLDELADKLFLMATGGGNEYCGQAIQTALDSLDWKTDSLHYRGIFIAGNEPFAQGPLDFPLACQYARSRQVIINTIYCGGKEEGRNFQWEEAAALGAGKYANINQDTNIQDLRTPYDSKIVQLYQYYKSTFLLEEKNSPELIGPYKPDGSINPIYRDMILYKIQQTQEPDDIIKEFRENGWDIDRLTPSKIPPSLNEMPRKELRMLLFRQSQEREVTRQAIEMYGDKVQEYLEIKIGPRLEENTLDMAVLDIVRTQLEEAGFRKK